MEVPQLKFTTNTDKFREPALHFQKYGTYCFAPEGTTEYIKYWTEEAIKCDEGYEAPDGDRIPGYFYFYLNYFPIIRVNEITQTIKGQTVTKSVKERGFPSFYDYDRFYFECVEFAAITGVHMTVLKSRRKGYSYKLGSQLLRNFLFHRESKGFAAAAEAEFLIKDGILTKAWDGLDFIDSNTAWYKKRQVKNTPMHKRASFIQKGSTGVTVELGYKSEIIGITLKNDIQKIRGKAGELIIFEEAGKFPNLLPAWQIARPSVEQGTHVFGTLIAFGTGGTADADFEGLKELFYNPSAYNSLQLSNVWDEGAQDTKCGLFIPQYANLEGTYYNEDDPNDPYNGLPFMDKDGNTDEPVAKKFILLQRQRVIDNSSDKRAIDRHVSEQPVLPSEAVLNLSTNIFPKAELQKHLSEIRNNKKLNNYKHVGELNQKEDGTVVFEAYPKAKQRDITKYRLSPSDDPTGQIVIWEHPIDNAPWGLYVGGCDPYDHDKSGTNSLGSVFIYKRFQSFEQYHDIIVAEYTGRPDTAEMFYENVLLLLKYYNATLLYENEKRGLFFYFDKKNSLHYLADQPNGILRDIVKDSKVERGKGIHMNQSIKDWGEGAIRDWLIEEYEPGRKNLHKILSEPLLEELISYNNTGNFDRVIAFMLVMAYRQELHKVHVRKTKELDRSKFLFPDGLFTSDRFQRRIFI